MYPPVVDEFMVGEYPAKAFAGGGYVWDAVLEYRVWCHPEDGAENVAEGDDYYYPFSTGDDAVEFAKATPGAEQVLALVLQEEYIDEPEPGAYRHVVSRRITEWPAEFLARPRRDERTIPDFMAPDAPPNRLEILRGHAPRLK